jgi:hypothetical protein
MNILQSIKTLPPLDISLIIVFILYIIFPFNTPASLASIIDSPLGIIVIFCVTVFLFLYANPILGVLYIFVAYELIRRSSQTTGRTAIVKYTPTQAKKDIELRAMNPSKDESLEEEIINIRAPVATSPTLEFVGSDFKPVYDKMLDGASML